MTLKGVLLVFILILSADGRGWRNYLLGLSGNYLQESTNGMYYIQCLEAGYPVLYRAMENCVMGSTPDLHLDGIRSLSKPCGFLNNQQPIPTFYSTRNLYHERSSMVLHHMNLFDVNITFRHINLLYSIHRCVVESVTLINMMKNEERYQFCGNMEPGTIQINAPSLGVIFRKHISSNSTFFIFYQVYDPDGWKPVLKFKHLYKGREGIVSQKVFYHYLQDSFSCRGCGHVISYIKLKDHDALVPTLSGVGICKTYSLYDGPSRKFPQMIPSKEKTYIRYPPSAGPLITTLVSLDYTIPNCQSERIILTIHTASHSKIVIPLNESSEYNLELPNENCIGPAHLTFCSYKMISESLGHFPQINVRQLDIYGFNTHNCDHTAITFHSYEHMGNQHVILCNKYLTRTGGRWQLKLPFDQYTASHPKPVSKTVERSSRVQITYYSYSLHNQRPFSKELVNRVHLTVRLSMCFGIQLSCSLDAMGGPGLRAGPNSAFSNLRTTMRAGILSFDYENQRQLEVTHGQLYISDSFDSYLFRSKPKVILTNVHLKQSKTCVFIQKYPKVIPESGNQCGYVTLMNKHNRVDVMSNTTHTVQHFGQKCVKRYVHYKQLIMYNKDSILSGYYNISVRSFVVGQCFFNQRLLSRESANDVQYGAVSYVGSYILENLRHIIMCYHDKRCGESIAHYAFPEILAARIGISYMQKGGKYVTFCPTFKSRQIFNISSLIY